MVDLSFDTDSPAEREAQMYELGMCFGRPVDKGVKLILTDFQIEKENCPIFLRSIDCERMSASEAPASKSSLQD